MVAHVDDWFGPDTETGILGHGHDGLVIDRIKHSPAAACSREQVAIIAAATIYALEQVAPTNSMAGWLSNRRPPETLWKDLL